MCPRSRRAITAPPPPPRTPSTAAAHPRWPAGRWRALRADRGAVARLRQPLPRAGRGRLVAPARESGLATRAGSDPAGLEAGERAREVGRLRRGQRQAVELLKLK